MIKKVIIEIIDKAIFEIEEYIEKYHIPQNSSLTTGHIKVLLLLKDDIIQNKIDLNERVLRAFKDVCTSTAIEHEESIFHNSIFEINDLFEKEILKYKNLELLRMDFAKVNPI